MAVQKSAHVNRCAISGPYYITPSWVSVSYLSRYKITSSDALYLEFEFSTDGSSFDTNPLSGILSTSGWLSSGNVSITLYRGDPLNGASSYRTITKPSGASIEFDAKQSNGQPITTGTKFYVRITHNTSSTIQVFSYTSITANLLIDTPTVTLSAPLNVSKDGDETIRFAWSVSSTGTNTKINRLYWKEENESDWQSVYAGSDDYYDLPAGTLPIGNIQWYVTSSNGYATGTSSTGSFTLSYDTPSLTITSPEDTEYSGSGQIPFAWTLAKGADSIDKTEAKYSINGGSYRTFVNSASLVTSYTAAAGFFNQPGTVQWRVRCRHKMAGWSAYATGQFTVAYAAPSVTLTAPVSESLYGDQAITFSWSITQGSGSISTTQLEYSADDGESWTSLLNMSGSRSSYTASAKSLSVGEILWRVRVNGQYTGWTAWEYASFTVLESIPVTSASAPKNQYVDRTEAATFTWTATIAYGSITGAELEYDLDDGQGWRALGTVTGSATEYTVPADTFPALSSIVWRVRAKNGDNAYGLWSSASFATIDAPITATPTSPITGAKRDETTAILFEWSTYNSLGSAPTGADLQWRLSDSDWQTLGHVDGSSKQFTAPANTFPGAYIYWRVRAYNQDGVAGSWSGDYAAYFSTIDTPSVATALSPSGTVEDADATIEFDFRIENQSGANPTEADLQYSRDNSTWITFASYSAYVYPGINTYAAPRNTFPPGVIYWRVRSYNRNHVAGDWSSPLSFVARAAPTVQDIQATAKPWATVIWQADDQQTYEIFVDGESLGSYFGPEKQFPLPDYLEDGVHTVGVRVMGSFSLWSQINETQITIANTQAAALTLTAETAVDTALTWEGGDGDFFVYRDGLMIAHTNEHSFTDRVALGTHEYQVIERLASGDYNASETVTQTPAVPYQHIAALAGGDWISIPYTLKSQAEPSYQESQETVYNYLSGNDYPTASIGSHRTDVGQYSAVFLYTEEASNRAFLALRGKPVILKTADGEVMIGVLNAWERRPKSTREKKLYTAYTFSLQRIGWEDFIDDTA